MRRRPWLSCRRAWRMAVIRSIRSSTPRRAPSRPSPGAAPG
jgi:hypothetical protein